jgi:signal transduction histidine kinase
MGGDDSTSATAALGIVVVCDGDGRIHEVLANTSGLASLRVGASMEALFPSGTIEKWRRFLALIRREGHAFSWELNVDTGAAIVPLVFAGGRMGGRIVLLASSTDLELTQLYEEVTRVNNEQANMLRSALKDLHLALRERPHRSDELYTQMSRLNNELAAMQRDQAKQMLRLEQLNEQKGQLLGMAAHDLRNPLSVIRGYADFLLEQDAHPLHDELRQMVGAIQRNAGFMLRLVNDLLEISKLDSGKLVLEREPVDLTELIDAAVRVARTLARPKGTQVTLDISDGVALRAVRVDPHKLRQVIDNLLSNAIKYSAKDSVVRVVLQLAARTDSVGQRQVELAVHDSGQGIPHDEMSRLFEPFGTTSTRGTAGEKSTGLGLAIVRRIVQGHGGTVQVESQLGVGSSFVVRLPLAEHEPIGHQAVQPTSN